MSGNARPPEDDAPRYSGDWDDDVVDTYVETYGEHPSNRLAVSFAGIGSEDTVIDVGCGSGAAAREAAATARAVLGIDPNHRMLAHARERSKTHARAHTIEFRLGQAEALPAAAGQASVVLAVNAFYHWSDCRTGLREIYRVLAPGGRLVFCHEDDAELGWSETAPDTQTMEQRLEDVGFVRIVRERRRLMEPTPDEAQWLLFFGAEKPMVPDVT